MPSQRNVLIVFLASPGDLNPERQAAREVVAELNESVRDINWHIELLGWEDTLPGAGRPQEIINADVDVCHLFFGMLWKWWGTPTGKYSSGFEEEYDLVSQRRKKTGEPQIMLVFKEIDSASLVDPGKQLKKVVEFRDERVRQRDVLFERFSDIEDFRKKLRVWLNRQVLRLHVDQTSSGSKQTKKPLQKEVPAKKKSASGSAIKLSSAIKQVFRSLNKIQAKAKLGERPEALDTIRTQLIGHAFNRLYTAEFVPAHFANLVYKLRESFSLTRIEVSLLFQTYVDSTGENIPGWYWIGKLDAHSLLTYLVEILEEGAAEKRVQSTILKWIGYLAKSGQIDPDLAFIKPYLEDSSTRPEALELLGVAGGADELEMVDAVDDEGTTRIALAQFLAKLRILLKMGETKAVSELLLGETVPADPAVVSELNKFMGSVKPVVLSEFLKSKSPVVRESALSALVFSGSITKELLKRQLDDKQEAVRLIALEELAARAKPGEIEALIAQIPENAYWWPSFSSGAEYPPVNRVRSLIYGHLDADELIRRLDFYDFETPTIIRALGALHPGRAAEIVRGFLVDDLKRFREESLSRLNKKYETGLVNTIISNEQLYSNDIIGSCLAVLSVVGKKKDAKLVRRYLTAKSVDVQVEAAYALRKVGTVSDAEKLKILAESDNLEVPVAAARAFIHLSEDKIAAIRYLLELKNEKVVRVLVDSFSKEESEIVKDILIDLLLDPREMVRKAAVAGIVLFSSSDECEILLKKYQDRDSYYYNVVYWLDILSYAPAAIRDALVAELKKGIAMPTPDLESPFH